MQSFHKRSLQASDKILFLQEIREHLLLSPEEYRLLVLHVLRRHRQQQATDANPNQASDEDLAKAA